MNAHDVDAFDPETKTGRVELPLFRFQGGEWRPVTDAVTEEVSLRLNWRDTAAGLAGSTLVRAWPHNLEPLALGHALLELSPSRPALPRAAFVVFDDACSCIVTLGPSAKSAALLPPARLDPDPLLRAMRNFIDTPGMWDETGCFHRAGVFDPQKGALLGRAEDIGRHNCLDRLAGWSALGGVPLGDKVLLTSARITASMADKALRAGFRVLVSRSAVTTAAIAAADAAKATLVGFARASEDRFTVFADGPGRLRPGQRGA